MKTFAAFTTLFAVALARPSVFLAPVSVVAPITSSQYHAQDYFGQYSYGYADPLSSKAETKTLDGVTRGGYNYVDAEGKLQSVEYTADEVNGFKILKATNLPVAPAVPEVAAPEAPAPVEDTPEVAEAKSKHFEEVEKAKTRAAEAPAPVHVENVPYVASFYHSVAPVVAPVAGVRVATTGTSYSYGVPTAYTAYSVPAFTTYTGPFATTHVAAPLVAPVAPSETPEVARARADHLAEFEKVKARHS